MLAILRPGDLLIGDFLLTARAAELSPKYAMIATDPRRQLWERVEAAKSADALSVGLAQPHRLGNAKRLAGDALRMFCDRMMLRDECFRAGLDYDHQVRSEKSAREFYVEGKDSPPEESGPPIDEQQIVANREAAILALAASDAVLRAIAPRCPRRMVNLCFDRAPPGPYDDNILKHGLLGLARHYGILDEGINRDKPL